jgi:hypothetical protein
MTDLGPSGFDEHQAITTLEHELRLVTEAIEMVASGRAPSVTLAGIRFGDQILARARREADASGVTIRELFAADESGVDLRVERATVSDEAR